MQFNSLQYFILLPLVYLAYYFTADSVRWLLLLISSFYFYYTLNSPLLIAALIVVILFNYLTAIALIETNKESIKKYILIIGITCNILILLFFKYITSVSSFFQEYFHSQLKNEFLISIGVSYFVFQAVSYLIDVYLEFIVPERHLGYFALYLAFFPKLLQGPIERSENLLPQLKVPYIFNYNNIRSGMFLFAFGLFKKVVIADRLALFVNPVYDNVHAYGGLTIVLATYLYAFQIFFDFSGYTDMALGSARLFNITLTQNFNSPYLSTSIAEFWRRWHISFSSWILNYVFQPLQMRLRKLGQLGTIIALLVAFLVSGIWHGASWNFVIWGLLHGIYLASSVVFKPIQKIIYKFVGLDKSIIKRIWQTFFTFNLVCFAWIFFRANSYADSIYIVKNLFNGFGNISAAFWDHKGHEVKISLFILVLTSIICILRNTFKIDEYFYCWRTTYRWLVYIGFILFIMIFTINSKGNFIYYRF